MHILVVEQRTYNWWMTLLFLILLGLPPRGAGGQESRPKPILVVLDPGHGGKQEGAVSKCGILEKDLVLDVALRTQKELKSVASYRVLMTRKQDRDVSLDERIDLANRVHADIFVSIHANAFFKPSLSGVETFFHSVEASGEEAKRVALFENAVDQKGKPRQQDPLSFILEDMQRAEKLRDSSRLAHFVQEELVKSLPFENRGVMQADFVVLGGTRMPSILIEIGFLTNPSDAKALKSEKIRTLAAKAIREALVKYQQLIRNKNLMKPEEKTSVR